jgi:hypothetical protein
MACSFVHVLKIAPTHEPVNYFNFILDSIIINLYNVFDLTKLKHKVTQKPCTRI